MADSSKQTDGPAIDCPAAWDFTKLPDWDDDFVDSDDILAFAHALSAPEQPTPTPKSPSEEDLVHPKKTADTQFITALNDWKPVRQRVRGKQRAQGREHASVKQKKRRKVRRGRDETREGWTYSIVKYPLLLIVLGWIFVLGAAYLLTRLYIWTYEQHVAWRGRKNKLRKQLRAQTSYEDWVKAAKELDHYLGSDQWKEDDEYAYYDSRTIRRVLEQMRRLRQNAEQDEKTPSSGTVGKMRPVDELAGLAEACVKNNFAGFENPRLYSETYYGTKNLVQNYVDEVATSLRFLLHSNQMSQESKRSLSKHLSTNFGRTALCLSGGATFAYYHFGIAKALLDADLLPNIITGTSGGALVAALLATRTDDELKKLLVPALANRITACSEPIHVWLTRFWRTGARFDSVDWAKRCSWFCHGSLTFLEAYQRTGRILNVTCVPSDPHSPSILANYLTAPDCVIWSAVLASAAVPGILNPVVLMRKTRDGKLEPYSFGHKWKDGSLRTDIPLKSLNLHFNVNFSIVSQVNPHINLFFFSSRGTVGRPVTHRRGRGWRGGFLGSAAEQYLKLDLNKWLKVLRHLELLPRPMGQDWSEVWLQRFSGTITIWPRTIISDYWNILSDPDMKRLARMIHVGQLAAWPKLKFISNRMAIEKVIEEAREATRPSNQPLPTPMPNEQTLRNVLSEENLQTLLERARANHAPVEIPSSLLTPAVEERKQPQYPTLHERANSPSFGKRISGWFSNSSRRSSETARPANAELSVLRERRQEEHRRGSVMEELKRQGGVFWDDPDTAYDSLSETDAEVHTDGTVDTEDEEAVQDEDALFGTAGSGYGSVVRRRAKDAIGGAGGDFELNG
ncbi:patatin-like phospholipase domain-containing protein [Teratosphaeria destructans]|uniref:Patatin-like phospholipase domain-containing protein n=1 Tax=Teratosphaeria destructans TaxID=418781 RepID=A0A9W7W1Y8_9PEZI|nr:patatin-like phospholipase domain-containing protein [Teratosphaeria destructans]